MGSQQGVEEQLGKDILTENGCRPCFTFLSQKGKQVIPDQHIKIHRDLAQLKESQYTIMFIRVECDDRTSSSKSTSHGAMRPITSCTRRRSPSEIVCICLIPQKQSKREKVSERQKKDGPVPLTRVGMPQRD